MDLSGFSSPRSDCFPAGLRVLVVDDDATWLKILEKMLKKCDYEVTTCSLARDALNLLRERKDTFDIVISDVTMPDMDGFKLLEHVGLEMDLPVIMMSVDGETSRVMKGVQHGACDYLLKPIRMKELRNIWQHVYRKRMHEVRDVEEIHATMKRHHGPELSDDFYVSARDLSSGKRRKYADNNGKNDECRVFGDHSHSATKRARVVWTVDLHQKFVKAVNQIGFEKVGPKKILDLMGVPWLTRENVASHLQKYRLYLSRLEKEDEIKETYFGANQQQSSDHSPEDFDPGLKISSLSCDSKHEISLIQDKEDVSRDASSSKLSFNHSTDTLLDMGMKSELTMQRFKCSWGPEMSSSVQQLEPDCKSQLIPHDASDKLVVSSDKLTRIESDHSNNRIQIMEKNVTTQVGNTSALSLVQPEESPSQDFHPTEQNKCTVWTGDAKSSQGNLISDTGSSIKLWDEEFNTYSSQVDFYPHIDDLVQELSCDGTEQHLYATWSFNCEHPNDTVDCSILDQELFVYSLN